MELKSIDNCKDFSEITIDKLHNELSTKLSGDDYSVVTCGSFARKEASEQSDIDYFIITDSDSVPVDGSVKSDVNSCIGGVISKPPSPDGAFAEVESIEAMTENIGGNDDTNDKITRRILLLLEGDWLYNKSKFHGYRKAIIDRYIRDKITDHQLSRFFLNDLIRYYRTLCVDFEYKTIEGSKPWGTRNIKLTFSRKLIYFSGILVAAETAQRTYECKINKALELINLTPIERIKNVCGSRADRALRMYDNFLEKISDKDFRSITDQVTEDRDTHKEEFRVIKNEGHHFSWELAQLLRDTYNLGHPIHNALLL